MIGGGMGAMHFASAIAALVLGAMVLWASKGTVFHRTIGAGFVAAMVILNVSSLAIYRLTGHFEPFHALALFSLATVVRGMVPALRRRPGWLMAHYWSMAWSYRLAGRSLQRNRRPAVRARRDFHRPMAAHRRRYRDCDFVRRNRDDRIAALATNRNGSHELAITGLGAKLSANDRACKSERSCQSERGSHVRESVRPDRDDRVWNSGWTLSGASGGHKPDHVSILHVQRLSPAFGAGGRNRDDYSSRELGFSGR